MFDEDFLNNLQQASGNNPWPTHPTNWNYKIQLLKQTNCLLGFVFHNKYALKNTIEKKWLENQTNLKEDSYESSRLLYYKNADALVPMVRTGI
jgi:hypothetical protein